MYQVQCPGCGEVAQASFVRIGAVVDCSMCRCRYTLTHQNVRFPVSAKDNTISEDESGVVALAASDSASKEDSPLDASWAGLIPENMKSGDTAVLAALPPNAINKTPPKSTLKSKRIPRRPGSASASTTSNIATARQRPEKPSIPFKTSAVTAATSKPLSFPANWIGRLTPKWLKVGIFIIAAALLATAVWLKWQHTSSNEKQSIYVQADTADHP